MLAALTYLIFTFELNIQYKGMKMDILIQSAKGMKKELITYWNQAPLAQQKGMGGLLSDSKTI